MQDRYNVNCTIISLTATGAAQSFGRLSLVSSPCAQFTPHHIFIPSPVQKELQCSRACASLQLSDSRVSGRRGMHTSGARLTGMEIALPVEMQGAVDGFAPQTTNCEQWRSPSVRSCQLRQSKPLKAQLAAVSLLHSGSSFLALPSCFGTMHPSTHITQRDTDKSTVVAVLTGCHASLCD